MARTGKGRRVVISFNSNQFQQEINDRIDKQARQFGRVVVDLAQRFAPKRTGKLATSISYAYDNQTHSISFLVGAPYGVFQEFGTRYMNPHPYLRPALAQVAPIYGFNTSMEFLNTYRTDTKLLAHGDTFQMHQSLTAKQKAHVRANLKPVSKELWKRKSGNVSRAKLKVSF